MNVFRNDNIFIAIDSHLHFFKQATSNASPEIILAEKKAAAAAAAAQRSSNPTADHSASTYLGIAGSGVGMWLGLDREHSDDSMKDYDPAETEYADVDGYTLREKYYDPYVLKMGGEWGVGRGVGRKTVSSRFY